MFEVRLYKGDEMIDIDKCDVGQLLPTIAKLMQLHESGGWKYQINYTIRWRRVKE